MFRRGFKSWCEKVSFQQRRDLRLGSAEPLDPWRLAHHVGVVVLKPEEIPDLDPAVIRILLKDDPDSWSAVTISIGRRDLIVLNSSHTGGRPASDLMHELAHLFIGHAPARVDVSEDGLLMLNTYDKDQEAEATWLGGALLLPREALLFIRKKGISTEQVMKTYGVSIDMLNYRLRTTGVELQLRRARHRR